MTEPNEPAGICTTENGYLGQYAGLTKREHFAALAMQGLWQSTTDPIYDNYERIANMAVSQADALITALNKPLK